MDTVVSALCWPVPSLFKMGFGSTAPKVKPAAKDHLFFSPIEQLVLECASTFKVLLAVLFWNLIDFSACKTLQLDWTLAIVVRDVTLALVVAGGWDYILYFSPLKDRLHRYKINPSYPSSKQFQHDMFWTLISTLISSVLEIIVLHCFATEVLSFQSNFVEHLWWNVLWILSMPYWRIAHFYFIHRALHPWKMSGIPDGGKYLYKHVHSLHHKSRNPTAFSGISMHPVESSLYFSAALIPIFFNTHPLVFLVTKVDLSIGAMIGHDGYQPPGGASYYHYLHHKYLECNYGEPSVPLDWLFGTSRTS